MYTHQYITDGTLQCRAVFDRRVCLLALSEAGPWIRIPRLPDGCQQTSLAHPGACFRLQVPVAGCVCLLPQCAGHVLLPACQLVLAAMNPLIQNMAGVKTGGMPLQPWQMRPNSGQARQVLPMSRQAQAFALAPAKAVTSLPRQQTPLELGVILS